MKGPGIRIGLRGKVALLLGLLLAAVLVLLSTLVLAGIREDQRTRLEQNFAHQTDAASLRVREVYLTSEPESAETFMKVSAQKLAVDLGEQSGMPVTLYGADGSFAGTSLPFEPRAEVADALAYTSKGQSAYITEGDQLLYLAPLYNADEFLGTVQFHSSLADQHAFYKRIRELFLTIGAAVLAAGFLVGYLFVWRQVGVIGKLNQAAQRIGRGEYLTAPVVKRKDELGELAEGIFEMSGSIASSVDELQEEKQKLLAAIARLQELEQQQKQFIGNISHELKTPLTSILAYADLLQLYQDDPKLLDEARKNIRKETERLYKLVEKALQLSATDVYDFETKAERVALVPLLTETASRLQAKAAGRSIKLETRLVPGMVFADPENVVHIVLNLIDNAITYNKPGGTVLLSNRLVSAEDGGQWMEIEIRDTGLGIPAEAQKRIFDPFYRVADDRARISGGTGLGLALVRNLAEKQHGFVRLDESGPEGSRFVVTLPVNPLADMQEKEGERSAKEAGGH